MDFTFRGRREAGAPMNTQELVFPPSTAGNLDVLKTLAAELRVPVWTADADVSCRWFNQAWLTFRGRALHEEVGWGWLEGVHPVDLDEALAKLWQAWEQRAPLDCSFRLRRADGAFALVRFAGRPVFSPEGVLTGYVGTAAEVPPPSNEPNALPVALSPREREVLQLVANGNDNLQIAARLGVCERTVKAHVTALYRKLALENRVQLALWAADRGLRPAT